RLSCRTFTANAVCLQFHALAYNLANLMRTLAMPKTRPVVADQSPRDADQDRREGRQPPALRDIPDGRGRVAATDVRRHLSPITQLRGRPRRMSGTGWPMRRDVCLDTGISFQRCTNQSRAPIALCARQRRFA